MSRGNLFFPPFSVILKSMHACQLITLKNGLRLITIPMPQVKSVAVLVLVGVGSRHEDVKTNGLTHFYEHMAFKGTQKYPSRRDLGLVVDSIGATYNGATEKEYTAYWVKAEGRHLEKVLDVLSQIVCQPLLEAEKIEQEKPIILEEINMREDTPQIKAGDTLMETMFAGHPLGLSGAGEKEMVMKFKRKDFLAFKKKFYTGENIVIIIAGNPSIARITPIALTSKLVSKYFGSLPKGRRGKFVPLPKTPTFPKSPRLKIINKKTDQAHLALGFRGFSRLDDRNRTPQALLDVILGAGMSSRLFQKVREEKSLAYYIGSSVNPFIDTGLFAIAAGVDKRRVEEALKIILNELRASSFKLQAAELRKAKDYLRGHWTLSLENPLGYAWWYGLDKLLENRVRTLEEVIEITEKVTAVDVTRVARQIFTPQNLSLAVIGKGLKEEKLKEICSSEL